MPTVAEKRAEFRRLHQSGCFVIPNPWDVGTTLYLQGLGFKALATTSAGFAWAAGRGDGGITRDMAIKHIAEISAAASVPVNADFEGGFADEPEGVAESVRLCAGTGVSGLSIEDYTGNKDKPLYDLSRFTTVFRQHFGMSPHQYFLRLRIQHAQELLRSTDLPLKQIADYCGFADVHHFSKTFRRRVQLSPGAFRRG